MAIQPKQCGECGETHCYWCGWPFPQKRTQLTMPTREHLVPRGLDGRNTAELIPTAHQHCNSSRGHAQWVPFHERTPFSEPAGQAIARIAVEMSLQGKMRPRNKGERKQLLKAEMNRRAKQGA